MIRRILIGVGIVVVLLVAAALVVPSFIPIEAYKGKIQDAVQQATGRPFKIKGSVRFALLPNLSLEVNEVSFGNAPGAKEPEMAALKQLVLDLKLRPLLRGAVEVDRFVLVDPVIHLEVDKSGRPNWIFAQAVAPGAAAPGSGGTAPAKPQPNAAAPQPGGSSAFLGGRAVSLGEVRLRGGEVSYLDDRNGTAYKLDKIAMTVSLPDLQSPFGLDGQFDWNGQTVKLSAKGKALGRLMGGAGGPLALSLGSRPINLSFDGRVMKTAPLALDGTVKLAVPSLRGLAAWVGQPLKVAGPGLGPLSIEGKLAMAGSRVTFSDAALALDDMKGKGEVTLDSSGARPNITAKLDLDKLDLNQYASDQQSIQASAPGAAPAAKPAPAGGIATAPSDWSDDPIDVSALKQVNADLAFSVGAILVQKIKIDQSRLTATLKDGLLTANLTELNLYKGKGQGRMEVDGRGAVAGLKSSLVIDGVEAEPFLRDATGNDRLSGKAHMEFDGAATGKSQRALVSALNGKGKVIFTNGAIKGINIAAMVRNVGTAFLDSKAGETRETDFSQMGGTYTITNGILTNKDLELASPLLRVTGAGTVDMPKRMVDYRITPKVVASIEGQGGSLSKSGVVVPIMVTGRWDNLHYQPDIAAALHQNAEGVVTGVVKGVTNPGGILSAPSSGSGGGALPDPSKALKNLFGK